MIISGPNVLTLYRVAQARSMDATKPALGSLNVEPFGDGVNIVACDGFVMALSHLPNGERNSVSDPVECLIPGEVLSLMKLGDLAKSYQAIALEMTEAEGLQTWGYFAKGVKTSVTLPKYSGTFPQWKKVIPSTDSFDKLERIPNSGYSLNIMKKVNDILGDKKYPFNLNAALSFPGSSQVVCQNDGITVITMANHFSEGSWEGPKLAILENVRLMGLIQTEATV